MTFAEYNTDENFDNDKSSLDELVKLGLSEGKTSDEIKSALSPKWKNSKKIGEFDNYVSKYSTPKAEETKPTEEKVVETVTETSDPKKTVLDKQSQAYADKQSNTADNAKEEALNDIKKDSEYNWQRLYDSAIKRADAFKQIDDHMVEQLPTFMFKRYQNGEFGDISDTSTPEGKESKKNAQLRFAHFLLNGVQSKLKNASNAFMVAAGKSPIFSDTTSDYEKYQQTNFAQGMENRWNKYKADTDGAIKAVEKEYGNEQNARLAVEQFTRDHKANVKWNMMDQNQKVFALQVTKEIGSMLGGMDTSELANFIAGAALTGDMKKDEVIAIGVAKLAANAPDIIKNLPDGNIKDMVMGMIGGNPSFVSTGIGGTKTDSNGNETNLTGNLQNYEGIDGNTISFDFTDPKAKDKINGEISKLKEKYANGEIDAETFKTYYDPLYAEGKKHFGSFTTPSSDKALKSLNSDKLITLENEFNDLNKKAKNGELTPSKYKEQIEKLSASAERYGASEEMINYIKNKTVSDKTILKAAEKKSKKK